VKAVFADQGPTFCSIKELNDILFKELNDYCIVFRFRFRLILKIIDSEKLSQISLDVFIISYAKIRTQVYYIEYI